MAGGPLRCLHLYGGTLTNLVASSSRQCTHILDICRYTIGEIDEVSAYATRGFMPEVKGKTVDDAMIVNAHFNSGALASFSTGCFPLGGHSESPDGGIGLHLSSRNHRIYLTGWHFDGTVYSGDHDKSSIPPEENIFAIQDKPFSMPSLPATPAEFIPLTMTA